MACKRKTGSAFGFGAWFRESDVLIDGQTTEFVRVGDDGGHITNSFCPNCGAKYYDLNRNPIVCPRSDIR